MLFSKKPADAQSTNAPAPTPAPPAKPSKPDPKQVAAESAMSVVAQGMRVVGDIECAGVLKIEGIVEGSVRGARQLLLGRQGVVKGDLHAREIVLGGRVDGTVIAEEKIEIQGTAVVSGDVHTKSIVVLEGGRINGAVRMDDQTAAAAAALGNRKAATAPAQPTPARGVATLAAS